MVDPRTPVLVGVGQFTERIDDPSYRGMSAVDLATAAAQAALADTGADAATVAKAVDTVFGLRQFEISGPMPASLGKSNNYPRSVMQSAGWRPCPRGAGTGWRAESAEARHRNRQCDRGGRRRRRDDHGL